MKVIIAGGTGFIGRAVAKSFGKECDVVILSRHAGETVFGRIIRWDGKNQGSWSDEVSEAAVVVNLAGAGIADARWTEKRKRLLISSRIDATNALTEALRAKPGDRCFINTSGIGIYGDRGDEVLDEASPRGDGFLAGLAASWEAAASAARAHAHTSILRLGAVLDPSGGALAKMLPPFRFGLGGRLGTGNQWFSWVSLDDVNSMIQWVVHRRGEGIYNLTSPEPLRQKDFANELASALHRPAVLTAPSWLLRTALGPMASEVLLASQRAFPSRAEAEGFAFRHRHVSELLASLR